MSEYRDDILEVVGDRLLEEPTVVRGLIFGHPGFKIENRVFGFVWGDGLCLKLSKPDYQTCLELEEAEPFAPGGERPMSTWAVISYPEAYDYLENWHWVQRAMAYVVTDEGAPPKKGKKKKRG
ncbi:MAG: hypothetical protein KAU50_00640 [Candidatus Marinimicrobia bacterium]|nr:hypothetical protein [Candidatus Neomarinimicrobiota bacterium]